MIEFKLCVNTTPLATGLMNNSYIKCIIILTVLVYLCDSNKVPPKLIPKQQLSEDTRRVTKAGTSIALQCPVDNSQNDIYFEWSKDGKPVEYYDERIRITDNGILKIKQLSSEHTGNYICKAVNGFGSVEFAFTVIVLDKFKNKPEVEEINPSNITVSSEETAIFQCKFRSEEIPHIQWLKKLDTQNRQTYNGNDNSNHNSLIDENHSIKVHGESYIVLKTPQMAQISDGLFFNKLIIYNAKETDSGKYICLGANTMGYSFRSAYLTVLPSKKQSNMNSYLGESGKQDIHDMQDILPTPIVIALISVAIVVFAFILCICCYCQKHKTNNNQSNIVYHSPSSKHSNQQYITPFQAKAKLKPTIAHVVNKTSPNVSIYQPSIAVDDTIHTSPSHSHSHNTQLTQPFYSELITNHKRTSNVYQQYINLIDNPSVQYYKK